MARLGETFQLSLKGENIAPETVAASDLAVFLRLWEEAIRATAKMNGVMLPKVDGEPVIALVGVSSGSNLLTLQIAPSFLAIVALISTALAQSNPLSLPRTARVKLHAISKQAAHRDWEVELVGQDGRFPTSSITKGSIPQPTEEIIRGSTTLFGQCIRVGGAKPRAEIRTHDGKLHFIDIDREMGLALAARLWTKVSVDGDAEWDSETWEVLKFQATRLNEFDPIDSAVAFQEISEIVGHDWDDTDVPNYLTRLRDGDL